MQEHTRLVDLYQRLTRYNCIFALPVFTFLFLMSDRIMAAWMGPGFEASAAVIRILAASYCVNCILGSAVTIAAGMGAVHLVMRTSLIVIPLNLSLCILFAHSLGFTGVAWGTSISLVIVTIIFWIWFHREIGRPLYITLFPLVAPPVAAVAVSGAAMVLITWMMRQPLASAGRGAAIVLLGGQFFLFIALIGLLLFIMRYFDETDLAILRSMRNPGALMGRGDE